jgi:hypothetical protein
VSLLFISHSSKDNFQAVAIKDWLVAEGWNEIFLDLDPEHGIAGGEKWEQALLNAANRCDAVLYLISKSWLASEWCRWEFQLAQKLNKRLFILLIEEIPIAELPKELTESWQLVNLNAANDQVQTFNVQLPDSPDIQEVNFSVSGLSRLKTGLNKAGLDPSFFAWPPKDDPDRAPYRGLLAMEADDAGIFFGRDAPIIDLMAQLRGLRELSAPRMMVVLGASGAGKSSFLRAGILPRLARDDRYFHVLPIIRPERAAIHGVNGLISSFVAALPSADRQYIESELAQGEDGLHRLFSAVISSAQLTDHDELQVAAPTLVLSIDQGEELFQAEGSHEANQLLNIIRFVLAQDNPQVMVLFTIRSDSYEYLQSAAPLEGVTQKTFSLPAMPRGSYQQVIEGPAKLLSKSNRPLKVTPQLTEQLLQDIEQGGARDALPLLAFTLEQLYLGYSDDGELSRDDYLQMGGIEGAIKSAVEHALQDAHLNPHIPQDRDACLALLKRGLIPWLAGIDPQTNLPRRRVALMSEIPEEARPLIQHFIAHRLLATDTNERGEITVEPAHEALLRQWTILKGWLEEDAAALSALETLRNACRDWEANLREDKWLIHTGGRLDDAEQLCLRDEFKVAITTQEGEYLKACKMQEAQAKEKELLHVKNLFEAQKKIVRRTRIGLVVASALLVIAIFSAIQVFKQKNVAENEKKIAMMERENARLKKKEAEDLTVSGQLDLTMFSLNNQKYKHWEKMMGASISAMMSKDSGHLNVANETLREYSIKRGVDADGKSISGLFWTSEPNSFVLNLHSKNPRYALTEMEEELVPWLMFSDTIFPTQYLCALSEPNDLALFRRTKGVPAFVWEMHCRFLSAIYFKTMKKDKEAEESMLRALELGILAKNKGASNILSVIHMAWLGSAWERGELEKMQGEPPRFPTREEKINLIRNIFILNSIFQDLNGKTKYLTSSYDKKNTSLLRYINEYLYERTGDKALKSLFDKISLEAGKDDSLSTILYKLPKDMRFKAMAELQLPLNWMDFSTWYEGRLRAQIEPVIVNENYIVEVLNQAWVIDTLKDWLKESPESPWGNYMEFIRLINSHENGSKDAAYKHLFISVDSSYPPTDALLWAGFIKYKKNDYDMAIRYWDKAKMDPVALLMSALSSIELGEMNGEIVSRLEKALNFAIDNKYSDSDVAEFIMALVLVKTELNYKNHDRSLIKAATKNSNACDFDFFVKRNWHAKMLALLEKYRYHLCVK